MFSNPLNVGRSFSPSWTATFRQLLGLKTPKGTPLGVILTHDLIFWYPKYCLKKCKAVAHLFLVKRSDRTSMRPLSFTEKIA